MTFAWEPAPVVGGAYTDDTRPWSVQDTVNWIPVRIERPGGRSESMLRCAPGASVFCIPGPVAPVRGLHDVEGKLFAVIGTSLFQITPTGVAIPRGMIPGVGRVSMTHNQITGGNELVIANGYSGYVYSTKTEANAQQITDDGFPGFKVCDYVDSYVVGVEPAGRYWFTSDLAAATSYNMLDRAEAESQPDRIVGLIVNHREVFVLGERTGEFFRNTGAATGTFQRADGTEMDVGCASAHTIQKLDNSVFWLGNDGWVYRLNGYSPQRISTGPLEQAISRCNMAQAFAFTFEDRGHKIYYLTFPDGMTWGYDVSTGEWARRESFGFDLWRMNCLVRWNKQWIAGDFVNGKLYRLDWDMPWENGEIIERRRVTGVLHGNQNRITLDAVELVFDTGADDVGPGDLFPDQPGLPAISGDVPSGTVGDEVSGAYSVTGGTTPYSSVTISSGTFPPGLTLNVDGSYSGTYTTDGAYSWVVRVTDSSGIPASVVDSATVTSETPVLDGDFNLKVTYGAAVESTQKLIPRGEWAFVVGDIDLATGNLISYVNVDAPTTFESPHRGQVELDLVVGGIDYPSNHALTSWRGRLWGAGVANGELTSDERAILYNDGNGRSFADIAASADPAAVSLWSKIIYAWQLDTVGSYPDAKGNKELTMFGTVGSVIDAKFGRCFNGNNSGKLQAVGSNAQGIESTERVTYFAWIFSEVTPTDAFPSVICRYSGFGTYQGIRCYYNSGS